MGKPKLKDFIDCQMNLEDLARMLEAEGYICLHEWENLTIENNSRDHVCYPTKNPVTVSVSGNSFKRCTKCKVLRTQ